MSNFYKYNVVAKIGDLGLQDLSTRPSINDSGLVAFTGDFDTTVFGSEGIIVGDGSPGSLKNIAPSFNNPDFNFGSRVQINNSNEVVATRSKLGGNSIISLYEGDSIDKSKKIALGSGIDSGSGILLSTVYDYYSILPIASINNNGESVFSAFELDIQFDVFNATFRTFPGPPLLVTADKPVSVNNSPFVDELSLQSPIRERPMIADDGNVIVRIGNEDDSPIILFDNDLNGTAGIATKSLGFTRMGQSPGISDDGSAIAFYGDLTDPKKSGNDNITPGKGIFLSINVAGKRELIRVAGEDNNGQLDPGEFITNSGSGIKDTGLIKSFIPDSRVGVSFDAATNTINTTFVAIEKSTNKEAIFSIKTNLDTLVPDYFRVIGSDSINATDINIYDPINQKGEIAFWAKLSDGKQNIIKATPNNTDTDGDGLLDIWETQGIDYNGDGKIDLMLPDADPNRPDIYVEVDSMTGFDPSIVISGNPGLPSNLITNTSLDGVVKAFFDRGIHLHLDIDEATLPVSTWSVTSSAEDNLIVPIRTLKGQHFGTPTQRVDENIIGAKRLAYRYSIFGDTIAIPDSTKPSGFKRPSGYAPSSSTFVVTLGSFARTLNQQAGTFMHELGHALGLKHGGSDDVQYKPNYHSVMNYLWQFQYKEGTTSSLSKEEQNFQNSWTLDYSDKEYVALDETSLNETIGIGGNPSYVVGLGGKIPYIFEPESGNIDFNNDGKINNILGTVEQDINGDGQKTILQPHNDWANLHLPFLDSSGISFGSAFSFPEIDSLTSEDYEEFEQAVSQLLANDSNQLPIANDDNASTDKDTSVTISVLDNDTDADGDSLSIASFDSNSAQNGTIALDDNGTPSDASDDRLLYNPAAGFIGRDTFEYTVSDGMDTATATVEVTVNPIPVTNTPPVANNDTATTDENLAVTIDVLGNDTDADGDSLSIDRFDATSSQNGTIALDDNNTPADASDDRLLYNPAAGFTGTDTFEYTVSDGTDTATATVEVTVNPIQVTNTPPVASNDTATTDENLAVTIDVLGNDTDADGDSLSIDRFDATSGQNGTISLDDNNTPANASDDRLLYNPATGFTGMDTFEYVVSDGTDTATATVEVTVNPIQVTNTPPVANNDTATTDENLEVTIDVLSNDTDADGDSLSIDRFDATSAQNGTISLDDNNTPADTRDDRLLYNPATGFTGTDTFEYIVSDGTDTATATVEVTVNPVTTSPNEITGTPLRDNLIGTDGDDIITGGFGADNLTGGLGNDTFVYENLEDVGDTITDFTLGEDLIDFSSLLSNLGITSTQVGFTDNSVGTAIALDANNSGIFRNYLLVQGDGVDATTLDDAKNFIF